MRNIWLIILSAMFAFAAIAQETQPEATLQVTADFRTITLVGKRFEPGQSMRLITRAIDTVTTKSVAANVAADGSVTVQQAKLPATGGTYEFSVRYKGAIIATGQRTIKSGLAVMLGEAAANQDPTTTGTLTGAYISVMTRDGVTTTAQAAFLRRLNEAAALNNLYVQEQQVIATRAKIDAAIKEQRTLLDITQ